MSRFLVLSAALLLAAQSTLNAGPVTSVTILGQVTGGNTISANIAVSNTGQFAGPGTLSGKNAANGSTYSYPFIISKGTTASGKLVLTGNMNIVGSPPVTLSVTVPNGPMTFSYVINGNKYTMSGSGVVTAK